VTIRRISEKELRKIGRPGIEAGDVPPAGISPVLRASWKFARDTAKRFSKELVNDRTKEFLNALVKRFV
jgi:hypothetical protein